MSQVCKDITETVTEKVCKDISMTVTEKVCKEVTMTVTEEKCSKKCDGGHGGWGGKGRKLQTKGKTYTVVVSKPSECLGEP